MSETVRFAAGRGVVTTLLGLAAVFAAFAYAEPAVPGRLLLGVAAAGCAAEGLRCALVRPVVAADADAPELFVGPGVRPVRVRWADVARIGARVERRRAATARSLEIDVGDTVHVVASYRLGAPVAEVVTALEAARPR